MTNLNWKIDGLPVVKINDKLTVVLPNGQPKTVSSKDKHYDDVLQAISDKNWEVIPDLMDPKTAIHNFSDGKFVVKNGLVYIGDKAVPDALSKKIIEFANAKLPYEPLVKFWEKLQLNTSKRAVQGLYDFLLRHNYPITPDGNFIAYKGVRQDWTDQHTGKFLNTVGSVLTMPRNEVDEDPGHDCSNGFHTANYSYARDSYGTGIGGRLIMVAVSPEHVVSVPSAYDCAKLRVCSYEVLSEVVKDDEELTGGLYNKPSDDNDRYKCDNGSKGYYGDDEDICDECYGDGCDYCE